MVLRPPPPEYDVVYVARPRPLGPVLVVTLVQAWGLGAVLGDGGAGALVWLCAWLLVLAALPQKHFNALRFW